MAEGVPAGELGHRSPELDAPFHILTRAGGRGLAVPSLTAALHGTFAFLTVSVYPVGYFWVSFLVTCCTVLACYSISSLCGSKRWSRYQGSVDLWVRKGRCGVPCVRKGMVLSLPV